MVTGGHVAVYPVGGCWRDAAGNHWSKEAGYALVVSIRVSEAPATLFAEPASKTDIYTPVDTAIKAAAAVPAVIEVTG